MGAAVKKFLFDNDFASPGGAAPTSAQAAEAEARGYRNGFEAAQREAAALTERLAANATHDIAGALNGIAANVAAIQERMQAEALDIAVAVGRKLASELVAAEPMTEIAGLVSDCFRHLAATPHLAVRINDGLYDICRPKLDELARHSGFQGKLVILADPDIPTGDCRIEWADGGVVLNRDDVEARISELVARYMASRSNRGHQS
jgi:flagellar assembly protein FliH